MVQQGAAGPPKLWGLRGPAPASHVEVRRDPHLQDPSRIPFGRLCTVTCGFRARAKFRIDLSRFHAGLVPLHGWKCLLSSREAGEGGLLGPDAPPLSGKPSSGPGLAMHPQEAPEGLSASSVGSRASAPSCQGNEKLVGAGGRHSGCRSPHTCPGHLRSTQSWLGVSARSGLAGVSVRAGVGRVSQTLSPLPWPAWLRGQSGGRHTEESGFSSQSRACPWVAGLIPALLGACAGGSRWMRLSHIHASLSPTSFPPVCSLKGEGVSSDGDEQNVCV